MKGTRRDPILPLELLTCACVVAAVAVAGCARERGRRHATPVRRTVTQAKAKASPAPPATKAAPSVALPPLPTGEKLTAALKLPMRSRVAPLTMTYWGQSTTGRVLLDSLAEEQLFPPFDRVRWHRWLADGSLVLLNGEGLHRVQPSGEPRLLATVGAPHVDPRLSPDGRWVAVALERSITLVPTDGGAVKRLPQQGWVHSIGWHPDSRRIALSAGNRIRVATLDGDVKTLRIEPPSRPAVWGHGRRVLCDVPQVEWSADGEYLAYRVLFRGKTEDDVETEVRAMAGGRVREVAGSGYCLTDGTFSWALSGHALAYTGNFGDVDATCMLWTGQAAIIIFIDGTVDDYRRSAWQPHGQRLMVENWVAPFRDAMSMEGPVPPQFKVADFQVRAVSMGPPREDDWPEFEWAPSGKAWCLVNRRHRFDISPIGLEPKHTDWVGDSIIVDNGQSVQAAAVGPLIREVEWMPGEDGVSLVRELGSGRSALFAAPVVRGEGGATRSRQWLAHGKGLNRRGDAEAAAVCFRNAVRCAGMWAEPRVRLAQCYLDLSRREPNPACMAWLLWGAEWEMQQAARWQRLSDESRRFWDEVSARREHIYSALGIGSPQAGANLTIRKPDQPIGAKR